MAGSPVPGVFAGGTEEEVRGLCDFTGDNPYTVPQAEAEANARLFVASRDLLEALRDACLTYAVHGDQPPDKWLAAIAKAEGRTA